MTIVNIFSTVPNGRLAFIAKCVYPLKINSIIIIIVIIIRVKTHQGLCQIACQYRYALCSAAATI